MAQSQFLHRLAVPFLFILSIVGLPSFGAMGAGGELEAFFGHWKGSGITEQVSEAGEFEYKSRDLDITIRPTAQGFSVTWTAEARAEDGYLERRTGNREFVSQGQGLFLSKKPLRKGLSFEQTWARLTDDSLVVYVMEVNERGVYELSRYVRRLVTPNQMSLGYTRDLDGRPVRGVVGRLMRVQN